jgi:hypothetical protein
MSGRHGGARTARRGSALMMAVATVLGLWFGVSAPDVSPVAAPVPAVQVQPPDVPVVVPTVPPVLPGPQRGGRR